MLLPEGPGSVNQASFSLGRLGKLLSGWAQPYITPGKSGNRLPSNERKSRQQYGRTLGKLQWASPVPEVSTGPGRLKDICWSDKPCTARFCPLVNGGQQAGELAVHGVCWPHSAVFFISRGHDQCCQGIFYSCPCSQQPSGVSISISQKHSVMKRPRLSVTDGRMQTRWVFFQDLLSLDQAQLGGEMQKAFRASCPAHLF